MVLVGFTLVYAGVSMYNGAMWLHCMGLTIDRLMCNVHCLCSRQGWAACVV